MSWLFCLRLALLYRLKIPSLDLFNRLKILNRLMSRHDHCFVFSRHAANKPILLHNLITMFGQILQLMMISHLVTHRINYPISQV